MKLDFTQLQPISCHIAQKSVNKEKERKKKTWVFRCSVNHLFVCYAGEGYVPFDLRLNDVFSFLSAITCSSSLFTWKIEINFTFLFSLKKNANDLIQIKHENTKTQNYFKRASIQKTKRKRQPAQLSRLDAGWNLSNVWMSHWKTNNGN